MTPEFAHLSPPIVFGNMERQELSCDKDSLKLLFIIFCFVLFIIFFFTWVDVSQEIVDSFGIENVYLSLLSRTLMFLAPFCFCGVFIQCFKRFYSDESTNESDV